MLEKIKEKTDKSKNDKSVLKEYIKCFCESDKVSESVKNELEYKELKDYVEDKKDY